MGESLEELCDLIVDCPHKTAPVSADAFAYAVGTTAIGVDGTISFDKARAVDAATYKAWAARAVPEPGDLIFCREAPVGPVALVPEAPRVCLGQRTMLLRPDPDRLDRRWLAYKLRAPSTLAALLSRSEGSTVSHLNVSDVRTFEVAPPPLAEQRAIASVLGTLDDKLESNRRLVGHTRGVLAAAFERTRSGAADMTTLGSLGQVVGGGTPKSSEPSSWEPAEVPWITPKDMTALAGVPIIGQGSRAISPDGLHRSSAKLLPAGSVVYTSRATLGLVAITQQPLATNQGFISLLPHERFGSAFVYATLVGCREAINAEANGSTFLEVNKTNFKTVECPRPSDEAIAEFRAVGDPLIAMVSSVVREARTLTALRDALLPKLVSGQIRVPLTRDDQEAVETVADELETGSAPEC